MLQHIDLDQWLVIFVGDNGTPANVSPLDHSPGGNLFPYPAKSTCGERGIRVPFILCGAGLPATVSDRMAHVADILPTVAAYLGVLPPSGIDGVNLFGPRRREHVLCGNEAGALSDFCIRTSRYKLRRRGAAPSIVESLYDLQAGLREDAPRGADL